MPRILGVDIPNDKPTHISLRYIYGVGPTLALRLCEQAKVNPQRRAKELTDDEIAERLNHHEIPTDLPLVVQISRFDRWKDPEGVVEAYKLARREVECTLVLLGNIATVNTVTRIFSVR